MFEKFRKKSKTISSLEGQRIALEKQNSPVLYLAIYHYGPGFSKSHEVSKPSVKLSLWSNGKTLYARIWPKWHLACHLALRVSRHFGGQQRNVFIPFSREASLKSNCRHHLIRYKSRPTQPTWCLLMRILVVLLPFCICIFQLERGFRHLEERIRRDQGSTSVNVDFELPLLTRTL